MRTFTYILIGSIIIAILTNPSQERHREVLKNKFTPELQKAFKQKNKKGIRNDEMTNGEALGLMIGGAFAGSLLENLITTDNYILFSTTKLTWNGVTKVIGIGAFGNIFLMKDLEKFKIKI